MTTNEQVIYDQANLVRHAGIDELSTRTIACEEADSNTTAQIRDSFTGTFSPWLLVPPAPRRKGAQRTACRN
jgi:hypothetical protein